MKQRTVKKSYRFEGKSLHSGLYSTVCIKPAGSGSGIVFMRSDLGVEIPALAVNVVSTARSTILGQGKVTIGTVEHVLSALTGLGVDNALIEVSAPEMPILDGSALPYVEAIIADGLEEQDAERRYLELQEPVVVEDAASGSRIEVVPADKPSIDIEVDFNSKVLGVQTAHWDESVDFASQIAPCRTFCFFHELEPLLMAGLVKGGDLDNAIVVVENPVAPEHFEQVKKLFGTFDVAVKDGYLNNVNLRFPNECARHKLLDILGDMRLAGGYLKAAVTAYKPGHGINTKAAKAVEEKSI